MGPGMPRLRRVYAVQSEGSTRADAEWHGRAVACRYVHADGTPYVAQRQDGTWYEVGWWLLTDHRLSQAVLTAAPVVNGAVSAPLPRVALQIDVAAWCALEDRRAALKALCAWSKGPGVMRTTGTLPADLADRVRRVGQELGVQVEDVDGAVPPEAGVP